MYITYAIEISNVQSVLYELLVYGTQFHDILLAAIIDRYYIVQDVWVYCWIPTWYLFLEVLDMASGQKSKTWSK